jgi:uncharacterized alpha/beta hydrolase family protein
MKKIILIIVLAVIVIMIFSNQKQDESSSNNQKTGSNRTVSPLIDRVEVETLPNATSGRGGTVTSGRRTKNKKK